MTESFAEDTASKWLMDDPAAVIELLSIGTNVIIHSLNDGGAKALKAMLPNARVIPYTKLKEVLQSN
jgi:hypothetical protein